jgi:hypothetical protein
VGDLATAFVFCWAGIILPARSQRRGGLKGDWNWCWKFSGMVLLRMAFFFSALFTAVYALRRACNKRANGFIAAAAAAASTVMFADAGASSTTTLLFPAFAYL